MKTVILYLLLAHSALAATVSVSMTNFVFIPNDLTIDVGDTVTWRCDQGFHDTVSGSAGVPSGVWNSNNQFRRIMFPGESFSFTFTAPGTYPYYCTPHWTLGMVGTIRVNAVNTPPAVSITSPPDQANFSAPADIILEAIGSDAEGGALRVEFFMNDSSIGVLTAPPYRLAVNGLGAGNYAFLAVATDDASATASASVSVTVTNAPVGTPPGIITHPQSQTAETGTNVTFSAAAAGSSPLSWQWLFNGAPIPDATNSFLDLTNVQPTNAGQYFVIVSNGFGSATSSNATLTVIEPPLFPAKNDFNHDGQTDILWHHVDGRLRLWLMDGVTRIGAMLLRNGRPGPLGGRIAGTHDFDLDGNVDILWQRKDGSLQIWFMNGTNFLRAEVILPAPAPNPAWQVAGLGDFDRDLHADILLRHSEGYLLVWYMSGKRFLRQSLVHNGAAVSLAWRVAGVADLDNNGYADILWQKPNSAMVIWFMAGNAPEKGPRLPHLPRVDARIVGLNDLNQDGHLDFIWRHPDGHLSVWWMNQTNRLGSFPINGGLIVPLPFKFAAPGS